MTPSSINGVLMERQRIGPDRTAYSFVLQPDGAGAVEEITQAALFDRVRALGAVLAEALPCGARVLLLHQPGIDYIVAFFACLWAGVVAVPAYPPRFDRRSKRLQAIARDCGAGAVLAGGDDVVELQELTQGDGPAPVRLFEPATHQGQRLLSVPRQHPIALLQYTSGSSGHAKGVVVSHENLLRNLDCIAAKFRSGPQTRLLSWLPPYHDMGLVSGLLEPMRRGFPVTLMSPFHFLQRPARWMEWISRTGATVSGGPNFAFELCVDRVGSSSLDAVRLDSLQTLFCGAEPIQARTLARFAAVFSAQGFRPEMFLPCYGLAEATLMVSGAQGAMPPRVFDSQRRGLIEWSAVDGALRCDARLCVSTGTSVDGQTLRIVAADTRSVLAPGNEGEVWVRSPSVAQGYWGKPGESADTFGAFTACGDGPFLRTGDLGILVDEELVITGRMKDLIILRGAKHYPQDIEQALDDGVEMLKPSCSAAFEYQWPGSTDTRIAIVAEIRRAHRRDLPDTVVDHIRRCIGERCGVAVNAVVVIQPGAAERTPSGKIRRVATKERFLVGSLMAWASWGDAATTNSEVAHAVT